MRPVTALFLGFIWSQFVATIWQSQRVSTNTPPRPLDSRTAPLYRPAMPTPDPAPESILIVDFGSQVTQLIARRVRERSEEHTSELQSLMRSSYAVFCLKKKTQRHTHPRNTLLHQLSCRQNQTTQ